MIEVVPLSINNAREITVQQHPVTVGVPIARSKLKEATCLDLQDENANSIPFHATPLGFWGDGSIRWILLDFQIDLEAGKERMLGLVLRASATPASLPARIQIDAGVDEIRVDTGKSVVTLSTASQPMSLLRQVEVDGQAMLSDAFPGNIDLIDKSGEKLQLVVTQSAADEYIDNPFRRSVRFNGYFSQKNTDPEICPRFSCRLTFYSGKTFLKADVRLHNPKAARHKKGLWDLGDPNSFYFKALNWSLKLAAGSDHAPQYSLQSEAGSDWIESKDALSIYQDSSGGEQWNCANHVNDRGEIPLQFKGYKVLQAGKVSQPGLRAQPVMHISTGGACISAMLEDFWQNFPSELSAHDNEITVGIFPECFADDYELQGGEQKTHSLFLDFSCDRHETRDYANLAPVQIPFDYLATTGVFPWLNPGGSSSRFQPLIQQGLHGEHDFFKKREAIDEYGWRHYGDVYADHEQLEYKYDDLLISHYNNQYDPLLGFILQYYKTGRYEWQDLIAPLARHVTDIDIYHTDQDRDEYNHGLFWHTDHYLNAHTCTHRTFSSHHAADYLYGETGGGPGAEHCYTTGLANRYFMTGETDYRDAALGLTEWIDVTLNGAGSLLERIFRFKSKEIPLLKRLLKGETIQRYRYPFTRGTGNYLTALIDAYYLTQSPKYLEQAASVIRQTIHPREDISLRRLDNIEETWSYLIFLQAVGKYIAAKCSEGQIDDTVCYARDSLLLYADNVLLQETLFLSDPAGLEFPNETWTAQDLRKAHLLKLAAIINPDKRTYYLEKAEALESAILERLQTHETRHYARILILLMQNDLSAEDLPECLVLTRCDRNEPSYSKAPTYSIINLFSGLLKDILISLLHFSWLREKKWLGFRLKR